MVMMNTNEVEDITDDARTLMRIDENERNIRRSVVAYLMHHSGQVFSSNSSLDSDYRASLVDDMASEAFDRMGGLGVSTNATTLAAIGSLKGQSDASSNPNIPIFHIDSNALFSETILPLTAPTDYSVTPPEGITSEGIHFPDYTLFRASYNNMATHVITTPKSVLFWIQRFEKDFIYIADPMIEEREIYHRIRPEWRIGNLPEHSYRDFQALEYGLDVGRLVKATGQVTEVGEIKMVMTHIAFRCTSKNEFDAECGNIILHEQDEELGLISTPQSCPLCSGTKFIKLSSKESRSEPMQRLTLQEEEIGGEARSKMVELRSTLCNTDLAGRTIEVTGALNLEPITKNSLIGSSYLLATNYRVMDDTSTEVHVSNEDEEEIQGYIDGFDLEERMDLFINSWAGHIFAANDVKKAIVLQHCRSPAEERFGHRSGIHILIMGDPGTAKSKFLVLSTKLTPGSRYVSADNATQAGLTGACSQVEDLYSNKKRWAVLPGDLGLNSADGVCSVDEFNLYKGDFGDFNNAMESGEVTISKIVKAKIPTRCSVLAGANPKGKDSDRKKFNKNNQTPYSSQIGLEFTILQRFDAIFILEDIANKDNDEKVALSMLQGLVTSDGADPDADKLSLDFMKKYLALCRSRPVTLSNESARYIASTHSSKRSESANDDNMRSHRQVASLARFSLAAARFDGVGVATLKHVKFAEDILKNTLQERDPGAIDGGMTQDAREIRQKVAETFVTLIHDSFWLLDHPIEEIYSEMSKHWDDIPNMTQIETVLKDFTRNKAITQLSKKGNQYTYDGVENPAIGVW
jgi:DNA replicative helicase MCM subunit Mcm2 (Cdc46/Mcm family)